MSDVNLLEVPTALAERLGISTFAGGIFMSIIILVIALFPFAIWKRNTFATLIIGFSLLGFLVSISWFPAWTLIVLVLMIAGLFGTRMMRMGG